VLFVFSLVRCVAFVPYQKPPSLSGVGAVYFCFLSPALCGFGAFPRSFLPYREELCAGRLGLAKQTIRRLMKKTRCGWPLRSTGCIRLIYTN
jgi:hypothetical protein